MFPYAVKAVLQQKGTADSKEILSSVLKAPDVLALQRLMGNAAVCSVLNQPFLGAGHPNRPGPIIQRTLGGEFLDPTPSEDEVLMADVGETIISPLFRVKARITTTEKDEDCAPGQYRQYVKGAFRQGGIAKPHHLGTVSIYGNKENDRMSETDWKEDTINGARYGYRKGNTGGAESFYKDDEDYNRAHGCNFESSDRPSSNADDDEMDLQFRGVLIDTSLGNSVMAERHWSVYGSRSSPKVDESATSDNDEGGGTLGYPKSKKKTKKTKCAGCVIF